MTFTPYTKDAITKIKNGATPNDLGWSSTFHARVCREHGISANVYNLKSHTAAEIAEKPTPPLAPVSISCTQAKTPTKKRVIKFAPVDGECVLGNHNLLRRGRIYVQLEPNQATLLRELIKLSTRQSITVDRIAVLMDVSVSTATVYVSQLRVAILRAGVVIPRLQSTGLFVLRDKKTELPVSIRVTEAAP